MFDVSKSPPKSQFTVNNELKIMVSFNKMISVAAAGKVKTCHHHLQVSHVAIHVYPVLRLL